MQDNDYIKQVSELLTEILSRCGKSNDYLEKIILTGIFDTLKKEGSSGFNNLAVHDITDVAFGKYFGFSKAEVENLINKLQVSDPGSLLVKIKE